MPECWHFQPTAVNLCVGYSNPANQELCFFSGMSTGKIIRSLRKERGMTQSEVAAALGWGRGTLAAIERGHDQPGAELVMALATFFQTTTDHILNRHGVKTPPAAQNEREAEALIRFREASDEKQLAMLAVLRAMTDGSQ